MSAQSLHCVIHAAMDLINLYSDRKNLRDIADRMIRLAFGDPKDFTFQ